MKLSKISLRGKYIGTNKRGLVVGGIPMLPGMPATLVSVEEETYNFLVDGQKSGWFKIERDNYEQFCITRERTKYESPVEVPGEVPDIPDTSEDVSEVTEAAKVEEKVAEEKVEAKPKKPKKTTKKVEAAE